MMNEFADALFFLTAILGSFSGFIIWIGIRHNRDQARRLKAREAKRKASTYTKIPQRQRPVGR